MIWEVLYFRVDTDRNGLFTKLGKSLVTMYLGNVAQLVSWR
jgi:hypothetical protein